MINDVYFVKDFSKTTRAPPFMLKWQSMDTDEITGALPKSKPPRMTSEFPKAFQDEERELILQKEHVVAYSTQHPSNSINGLSIFILLINSLK